MRMLSKSRLACRIDSGRAGAAGRGWRRRTTSGTLVTTPAAATAPAATAAARRPDLAARKATGTAGIVAHGINDRTTVTTRPRSGRIQGRAATTAIAAVVTQASA